MEPTLAGFLAFIANVMQISTSVLPANSPVIQFAYQVALELVNPQLLAVPPSSPAYPGIYALTVYNLAGDRLVNFAQDQAGAPVVGDDLPFFAYTRKALGINSFVGGIIQSTSDDGTSQSMVVPEQMQNLTFFDLQTLKTPWGRTYMGLAQSVGTLWGIS